jgi:hypothetical protein
MLGDGRDRDRAPTALGRAMENLAKPIVVSTRKRANADER